MARSRWTRAVLAAGLVAGLGAAVGAAPAVATARPAASAAGRAALTPIQPGDWTSYRNRSGKGAFNQAETVLTPTTVAGLHQVGTISTGQFLLRTSQVGGTGHGMVYTRSSDDTESMSAYDLATGALRWTSYPGGNQLVVGDTAVYSISQVEQLGSTGNITAHDAMTGAVLWNIKLTTISGTEPPVLSGSTLVAVYSGERHHARVTFVRAINVNTGKQIWRKQFAGDLENPPSVGNGSVFLSLDGALTALKLTNGQTRWTVPGQSTPRTMVFSGDTVYALPFGGRVYALNSATGAVRWRATVADLVTPGDLALADGTLYVTGFVDPTTTSPDVIAYNAATGAVRWSGQYGVGSSAPVVAGDVLYFYTGGLTPGLQMVNPANGHLLSAFAFGSQDEILTEPMVTHGKVYFYDAHPRVIRILGS